MLESFHSILDKWGWGSDGSVCQRSSAGRFCNGRPVCAWCQEIDDVDLVSQSSAEGREPEEGQQASQQQGADSLWPGLRPCRVKAVSQLATSGMVWSDWSIVICSGMGFQASTTPLLVPPYSLSGHGINPDAFCGAFQGNRAIPGQAACVCVCSPDTQWCTESGRVFP